MPPSSSIYPLNMGRRPSLCWKTWCLKVRVALNLLILSLWVRLKMVWPIKPRFNSKLASSFQGILRIHGYLLVVKIIVSSVWVSSLRICSRRACSNFSAPQFNIQVLEQIWSRCFQQTAFLNWIGSLCLERNMKFSSLAMCLMTLLIFDDTLPAVQ